MYYPDELIEEIRVNNDIVDIISEYIQLKKKGNSHFGLCPFHNENTPSFSVSKEKQMYYCFGCGAGGNVYTFIMEIENYNFLEAVKFLADRVRITLPTPEVSEEVKSIMNYKKRLLEINRESAKYFFYQLYSNRGNKALQYLNDRKLNNNIMKKFGIGYSNVNRSDLFTYLKSRGYNSEEMEGVGVVAPEKNGSGYHDTFWNRIIFPIFDVHNNIIGFGGRVLGEGMPKYLNSKESTIYNKRKHLYGLNFARTSKRNYMLVVEGYMDVISLHQEGFDNAIATLGTSFTTEQAMLLKRYTTDIILCYDSDKAGVGAAVRAIPIFKRNGINVKVLQIPGYKDPDEYIKAKGKEDFEELIKNAQPHVMFEVDVLRKQFSLDKPDEKVKFVMRVASNLVNITNKVEREVYVKQIAKEINISEKAITEEINKIVQNTGIVKEQRNLNPKNEQRNNTQGQDIIVEAQRNLLAIIIGSENIFNIIKEYITPEEFCDPVFNKVANYIYEQYENAKKVELANIINKFFEIEEQQKVSSILNVKCQFETLKQQEKAINDLVRIIKQGSIDKLTRENEDLDNLQRIIESKRQLQQLYITLNRA